MFYVDTSGHMGKRDMLLLHVLPTVVVFLAFMGVTIVSWTTAEDAMRQEQVQTTVGKNVATTAAIKQRLDIYENILRGTGGLFNASHEVTPAEWQVYLSSHGIASRYPGIQGIGYVRVVQPHELQQHVAQMRANGHPNFNVFPSGDRPVYTSIDYIEPLEGKNLSALGYDMYSEPTRRRAMDMARDTGHVVASAVVTLIQEANEPDPQPGFLLYLPLYSDGIVPDTVDARRQRLVGYVYAPFLTHNLIERATDETDDNDGHYGFQVYSLDTAGQPKVYESVHFNTLAHTEGRRTMSSKLAIAGSTWEIVGVTDPRVVAASTRTRPMVMFWGGLFISVLIAAFIYLLLANRARVLAGREERGIQRAKDELLALASHQLRTPATGVKQYVGLLREGFAGELTDMQQELVNKAYDSNERQLVTINEMLFVARSDAGHWHVEEETVNVCALTRDVVEEQRETIAQRYQRLTVRIPSRPLWILGDTRYLRMALENLLSNASKYTKAGGKIRVSLHGTKTSVVLQVQDNGVGVPPEYHRLLFQKFSRVPNELTNKVVGSGIGLYLVKRVIVAHKGSVEFISDEGVGSTVVVTLRRVRAGSRNSSSRRARN